MGGIAGYLLVPNSPAKPSAESAVTATLDGKALSLGSGAERALEEARVIARAYVAAKVTLAVEGAGATQRTREELGARIDAARLAALLAEALDPRSALRRAHREARVPLRLPLPMDVDVDRALSALLQIKDELDRPAVDARIDPDNHTIKPDVPGRRLDVYATMARLDDAFVRGDAKVEGVVESVQAGRMSDKLEGVAFEDVLGWFETKYARDQKHEARTYNLHLAASRLNGTVIMPGDTFEFNEVVGPRTEVNGFRVAPVIAQGELVDGIGGGTCQIAGTLHGAAFFAGLDILERHPHTRPSFYIKMGMDAAVAFPTITLKLKNSFAFPVVLHETVEDGVVRAEVLGPRRTRDVTFVRKINEVVPFAEKEVKDPSVPRGKVVLQQRGIPGFKITRYRILREGGLAVREKSTDTYPPTSQIWRVGSGDPNPKFVGGNDEHPEYVADDYLTISQGPDVRDEMLESRIAGKYGTHGWMVREGFTKMHNGAIVRGSGPRTPTGSRPSDESGGEEKAAVD
jgi:vancomycin resistance protein YoaR